MENSGGNDVTRYTITQKTSSSEEFDIEIFCVERNNEFPIHEEYKLKHARSEFRSDTNKVCREALEEVKECILQKVERDKLFLKKSPPLLDHLKRRRRAYDERLYKLLADSRRQMKILNTTCEEVRDIRKEINELLRSMKK